MIFCTKFAQKGCFPYKIGSMNTTNEFCIFELVEVPNFSLNWQVWVFFVQICPKREFLVENGKIALVRASMVVTYYIILFHTRPDIHNGILMYLLFLAAEAIKRNTARLRNLLQYIHWQNTSAILMYHMSNRDTNQQSQRNVLIENTIDNFPFT